MNDFIKAAVLGHPVAHSKSPLIHNYWIREYGLQGEYSAIDVNPDNLKSDLKRLIDEGFTGFNLTVPHKILALGLCDEIDETARKAGAVNTIAVRAGKIFGTNTDVFGFVQNIKDHASDFDFTSGSAVVLGAGGAAQAIMLGLLEEGAPEIRLLNRSRGRAEALAQMSGRIKVLDWDKRNSTLDGAALLVNTTALGMDGQPALELDLDLLPQSALVNDIVYAPLETGLLKGAKVRGCKTVGGIGMLIHQARPAFELWFGVMPEVTSELEALVIA